MLCNLIHQSCNLRTSLFVFVQVQYCFLLIVCISDTFCLNVDWQQCSGAHDAKQRIQLVQLSATSAASLLLTSSSSTCWEEQHQAVWHWEQLNFRCACDQLHTTHTHLQTYMCATLTFEWLMRLVSVSTQCHVLISYWLASQTQPTCRVSWSVAAAVRACNSIWINRKRMARMCMWLLMALAIELSYFKVAVWR